MLAYIPQYVALSICRCNVLQAGSWFSLNVGRYHAACGKLTHLVGDAGVVLTVLLVLRRCE